MNYIVPSYFKDFQCKCGACRHPCCEGWPVDISKSEYYRLIGMQCPKRLRAKLDCALKIKDDACDESFAQIVPDWRGFCAMHREDGLCAIQAEMGEKYLPEICRVYPRKSEQISSVYKCTCSNSCEETVELLLRTKEKLTFEESPLSMKPDQAFSIDGEKLSRCGISIGIMQDRTISLPERLIALGVYLLPGNGFARVPEDFLSSARTMSNFTRRLTERSVSIAYYCEKAIKYYGISDDGNFPEDILQRYSTASKHLNDICPDWQIIFENLLVNHMYYTDFPYAAAHDGIVDNFISLITCYSFVRFNMIGYMADKNGGNELTDFISAMFRLIEHSDFIYEAVYLLKTLKFASPSQIISLTTL